MRGIEEHFAYEEDVDETEARVDRNGNPEKTVVKKARKKNGTR